MGRARLRSRGNREPVVTGGDAAPVPKHRGRRCVDFTEIAPKSLTQPSPGVYVFDMGQNFAGVARVEISGEPGGKRSPAFCRTIEAGRRCLHGQFARREATDTYICRGHGTETGNRA